MHNNPIARKREGKGKKEKGEKGKKKRGVKVRRGGGGRGDKKEKEGMIEDF